MQESNLHGMQSHEGLNLGCLPVPPIAQNASSGFEPELVDSESTVLPLDYKAITGSCHVSLFEMSTKLTEIDFTESDYFNCFIRKATTYTNGGGRTRVSSTFVRASL